MDKADGKTSTPPPEPTIKPQSKAPPPITPLRGGRYTTLSKPSVFFVSTHSSGLRGLCKRT